MTTNRTDFNETWLCEMPSGLGSFDMLKSGKKAVHVKDNLYKIEGEQVVFYWYEEDGTIQLGTELYRKPQGLIVSVTGKNPRLKGKTPYASDLYAAIIHDSNKSVRLLSDTQLSDEGYAIWKKLFDLGYKISVYDTEQPGMSFKTLHSANEMDQYFAQHDINYKRYQYVLSENIILAETRSYFNTRRYRELVGIDLTD